MADELIDFRGLGFFRRTRDSPMCGLRWPTRMSAMIDLHLCPKSAGCAWHAKKYIERTCAVCGVDAEGNWRGWFTHSECSALWQAPWRQAPWRPAPRRPAPRRPARRRPLFILSCRDAYARNLYLTPGNSSTARRERWYIFDKHDHEVNQWIAHYYRVGCSIPELRSITARAQ